MTQALAIVAAVLAVSLLIVVHEAGHFLAARAFGMRVERFSVGFGPVLLSFVRRGTEFAISALPLGGYVKIAGMAPGESEDPSDRGLFSTQPAWRRFLVILAGPAMNYVTAILIAWGLLASIGLRAPDPGTTLGAPVPGMPAEAAGLLPGDRVRAVAGKPVETWEALVAELQRHPGEPIPLVLERGCDGDLARDKPCFPRTVTITPKDDGGVGRIGVEQGTLLVRVGVGTAAVEAVRRTNANAGRQLSAFGSIFVKKPKVEGPVGIARQLVRGARDGVVPFLGLVWTISVVLAILNLLPIPALDGGRLAFLAFEIVSRRRVNERIESYLHFAGFVLLVGLLLAVTIFGDLPRLFGK